MECKVGSWAETTGKTPESLQSLAPIDLFSLDRRAFRKGLYGPRRATAGLQLVALVFSTELSTKEDCMPTFDQVPLQEAMLKTATGKTTQINQEYLGYIEKLTEGQAG